MIDYSLLCQAIDDWKREQRPASGPHAAAGESGQSFDMVEEMDSGVVMLEDTAPPVDQYAQAMGGEAVAGDGQVAAAHGYAGESTYAAAGDHAYSGDPASAYSGDPASAYSGDPASAYSGDPASSYSGDTEHDHASDPEGEPSPDMPDASEEDEVPIDTTPHED